MEDGLDESASESLLVSMDTITSFIPEDFSWEDSKSSGRKWNERTEEGGMQEEEKTRWKIETMFKECEGEKKEIRHHYRVFIAFL